MAAPYVATAPMRFVVLLLILIWIVTKSFDCTTSFWLIGLSLCEYSPIGAFSFPIL